MATIRQQLAPDAKPLVPFGPSPKDCAGAEQVAGPRTIDPLASADERLRSLAVLRARSWQECPQHGRRTILETKWTLANRSIRRIFKELTKRRSARNNLPSVDKALLDNATLIRLTLRETRSALPSIRQLCRIESPGSGVTVRAYSAMEAYLQAVHFRIGRHTLSVFFNSLQETTSFGYAEIWMSQSLAQLILLERIVETAERFVGTDPFARGEIAPALLTDTDLPAVLSCLQQVLQLNWKALFDEISRTDRILRDDPQGAYPQMDQESRHLYCKTVAELARRSHRSEREVAERAIDLACSPHSGPSPRAAERRSHVGYYLIDKGRALLQESIGYRASPLVELQQAVRRRPGFFYLSAIALETLAAIALFLAAAGLRPGFLEVALILLPAVECGVATTNLLVTSLIQPQRLPRLDFSKGIPLENATLVVIPALVTGEQQVRQAAKDLEIRYLANRDPNLHFALLTDLPDSVTPFDEKDVLAGLCSRLVEELNARYAGQGKGTFFHFHRHRVYNYAEGIWMGWERKRGKLLDLNNLLLNESDNFPVKIGDLSLLRSIKYVITLDLDTQLPRDAARKLIGALAHPLNRAVVDPATDTVVDGYGILQPRVGISIGSATRSRLAALFSMDTGFDIYTRAVSDVYQDLFGEGIFTGKGIYELQTFQQVLEQRFPCNIVLSHDLIEGVHARTGLISDVEVIDDYPSQVSAYTRRKHRWVRGDWQIILWLFPAVPDYCGRLIANPLSSLSRWKIADNLRRSLTEFVSFLLLVNGWLLAPGHAWQWTLAALGVMASPGYLQFFTSLFRAGRTIFTLSFWKNAGGDFVRLHAQLFLRITLLCYQSLVTLDAIVRSLVRMTITHKRLLQWETAAQSEAAASREKKDALESYLTWTPFISLAIATLILLVDPPSLWEALPFLLLWGCSTLVCRWLNAPLRTSRLAAHSASSDMLREAALRTWRFFAEFGGEDEHGLIPDVVHAKGELIAHRISPTNLGLLLNARLAAWDLGFLTLPELAELTEKTFGAIRQMPNCEGQLYNWYDTQSLAPLSPRFVSSVDNGNLVCCLWTLKQGLLEARKKPIFHPALWQGLQDYLGILQDSLGPHTRESHLIPAIREMKRETKALASSEASLAAIPTLLDRAKSLEERLSNGGLDGDAQWWAREVSARIAGIEKMVRTYVPWLLPEFAADTRLCFIQDAVCLEDFTLETAPPIFASLKETLHAMRLRTMKGHELDPSIDSLLLLLADADCACADLSRRMEFLEQEASHLADAQDFTLLYDADQKLLSIGYDAENERLHDCHYDLLASEARAATFVAIAKGDIPQDSWFQMKRPHHTVGLQSALISWSGTMFEYLLPSLWMRSYFHTMLDQSARTAVHVQREFAKRHSIPWGISESSCSERNQDGQYRYQAFGVQELAFDRLHPDDLVVSPYATFLSLSVDERAAIANLRTMKKMGLLGAYGFYEACDFTKSRIGPEASFSVVPCWMAHHQGMSLLAVANALCGASIQRRFHAEPVVAATERLLHEKFPRILSTARTEDGEAYLKAPESPSPTDLLRPAELWVPVGNSAMPPNP
jgi:cyclic beta-1,2-glucan glucanotransferase